MLKKVFFQETTTIGQAAFLLAFFSLISRLLGVMRDRILAGQFGAGSVLDIYYAAFRLPDFIFNIIVLGALSAGFVPVFTSLLEGKNKDGKCDLNFNEAWRFTNNILNVLILFLTALILIGVVFAPEITRFLSPGFSMTDQDATINLTRIMFLSPLLLGISGVVGGVLQSFKQFLAYSLSPIFYNLGIIVGALYLTPIFGINGLGFGVAIGAFGHFLIQVPAFLNLGFRYQLIIDFKDSALRKVAKMMTARTLTLVIFQVNLIIVTIIASKLESGSITTFNLANNLQYFPIGIFGVSIAMAAFPNLAVFSKRPVEMVTIFSRSLRQILFFIVPATVLILVLRTNIVRVILGSGAFDWNDTIETLNVLGMFSLSLFAQASAPLLSRVFYARQDSSTPFLIGLASVACNIVLSYWLSGKMGVVGLALAFSLSSILNFILLWVFLRLSVGNLDEERIVFATIRFSFAAIACGFAAQSVKILTGHFVNMDKLWGVFTQGAIAGIVGLLAYALILWILKSEEYLNFLTKLKLRINR